MKLLGIPVVRRRLEEIARAYEFEMISYKDGVAVDRDILRMEENTGTRLNFSHYMPDTESRIDRLRRVINGRPVAILLHGKSLDELEQRIDGLADLDICYFGLNDFWVAEQNILNKIDRNLSIAMCCGIPYESNERENTIWFMDRQDNNIVILDTYTIETLKTLPGFNFNEFMSTYDKKLICFTSLFTSVRMKYGLFLPFPGIDYPLHFPRQSSLSVMLSIALIGGASKVVFFGGDGGRVDETGLYFSGTGNWLTESVAERSLTTDTRMFNATMPLIIEKLCTLYKIEPVEIINCSLKSHYTPFKKLSYDETISILKKETP